MNFSYAISEEMLDKLLARLRDACLFLIKSDGLALAALATLASIFKLEGERALEAAASIVWVLQGLVSLLAGSLLVWALMVIASAPSDTKAVVGTYRVSIWLFFILVLAHTTMLSFGLGYLTSFLEHVQTP